MSSTSIPSILIRSQSAVGERPLISVDPVSAGWEYIAFEAYKLVPGQMVAGDAGEYEAGIVVLGGVLDVQAGESVFSGVGKRKDVWEGIPPYAVLIPPGRSYSVTAVSDVHFVVAKAKRQGEHGGDPRLISPGDIVVEERGEGQTYRRIHHMLPPTGQSLGLILVEVYTPAGNWSSFPPHKHDTENPPKEAYLEEIYYYQINPKDGFALQRVYTDDLSIDQAVAPGDGDAVLVPKGYHPVSAMPGYDCYYLNVMAGPTKAWNFTVDPRYQWLMNWKKPEVAGGEKS